MTGTNGTELTVLPSEETMERFLVERVARKSNKAAARAAGVTMTQVKQYRDQDLRAGGDFAARFASAVGTSVSTPLTQKIQDTYHDIFEVGGELDRFTQYLREVPLWAHFMVEKGRSIVIEVADAKGKAHDNDEEAGRFFYWDQNPDWREARRFCMQYPHRDLTPRLGMALVQHVSKTEVDIDKAKLGEQLINLLMEERDKRQRAEEFQVQELARFEDEERSEQPRR